MKRLTKNSKYNNPALVQMREVAFGKDMTKLIRDTRKKSEEMRDDQALLDAAEQKRQRKLERRAKHG